MKRLTLCSTLVLTALLAGCQSTSEKIAEQEQRAKIQNTRFTESEVQIKALQARLDQAKQDKLAYFAPDVLEEAQDSYKDAKKDFDAMLADRSEATKSKTERIMEDIHEANRHLDAAYLAKKNAETILAESFDIRNQLQKLEANKLLPKAYRSLSKDIDDIVEDIADGDLDDAREDNGKLLPKLRAFEVRIVKMVELKTVRTKSEQLKKSGAKRAAPATYQQALSALANAESTITADPRNKENIAEAVGQAEFQLDRANHMLQAVKELAGIKRSNRETYLLGQESQLFNIAQELANKDLRNLPIKQQAKELLKLAQDKNNQISEIAAQLATLEQSMAAGDKQGDAIVANLNKEKSELKLQLQQKSEEIKAQQESQVSLQQNISALNTKITEMQTQDLEKQRKLLQFEKDNLALQQQLARLQAQLTAAATQPAAAQPAQNKKAPALEVKAKAKDEPVATTVDSEGIDG